MTDISPMWRIQAMTEVYGPCGIGWKWEVVNKWLETIDDEILAFVDVNLYIRIGENWSDPIPGNGGAKLKAKEKNGVHISDEAFKMASTDALSTSMKMLGVGADIYMGLWDGSKYRQVEQPSTPITGDQEAEIVLLLDETETDTKKFKQFFKINEIKDLDSKDYDRAIKLLSAKVEKKVGAQ